MPSITVMKKATAPDKPTAKMVGISIIEVRMPTRMLPTDMTVTMLTRTITVIIFRKDFGGVTKTVIIAEANTADIITEAGIFWERSFKES